tara:strand:- start:128 stop:1081 length:954 start_codon:yes stop_codon:yes gene_type:complete
MIELYKGDCLIESDKIESGSVDLILTDLPFGTMKGLDAEPIKSNNDKNYVAGGGYKKGYEWDKVIDIKEIYKIANRILRKNGKMILFCQEPFTNNLITEAIPNIPFSYRAIWEKNDFANCLFAKKAMVNYYEDVLVFSKREDTEWENLLRDYAINILNWIEEPKKIILDRLGMGNIRFLRIKQNEFGKPTKKAYDKLIELFNINEMKDFKTYEEVLEIDNQFKNKFASTFNLWQGKKYKSNILKYKKDYNGFHPTQKPVLLLEDLIKTFSNENDLVLDFTMGSGSTGVACKNTNRNFIGIEMDAKYFDIATERINKT